MTHQSSKIFLGYKKGWTHWAMISEGAGRGHVRIHNQNNGFRSGQVKNQGDKLPCVVAKGVGVR